MKELELVGDSQVIPRLCLLLYAILFEYNIHSDYVNRNSTEHVFMLGNACFQVKYYRVFIARAAVNESVCEDSHAEFAIKQKWV